MFSSFGVECQLQHRKKCENRFDAKIQKRVLCKYITLRHKNRTATMKKCPQAYVVICQNVGKYEYSIFNKINYLINLF